MGRLRFLPLAAGLILAAATPREAPAGGLRPASRFAPIESLRWPAGTEVVRFENLEGIVLFTGTLRGPAARDTVGLLALDTGAGCLAVDLELARLLGVADSAATPEMVDVAARPLSRLTVGGWSMEALHPVLTMDGAILRRVSDRPVLGLLGWKPLAGRVLWIDYRDEALALIPAPAPAGSGDPGGLTPGPGRDDTREDPVHRSRAFLAGALTVRAVPLSFLLAGDGKMLVRGAVADPGPSRLSDELNLVVDTGATKCVLFEESLEPAVRHAGAWPAMRGLMAPTLIGTVPARIARVPAIELRADGGRVRAAGVEVGVIRSELSAVLSRVTGRTIHGLIGYSFLKRFRVAVDYPNRILWLDPIPNYRDDRPLENCHVGLQLERRAGAVVVLGVVEGSPAARSGIAPGDELVALDGAPVRDADLMALARAMEGRPGSALTLVLRRDGAHRTLRLFRRRLL